MVWIGPLLLIIPYLLPLIFVGKLDSAAKNVVLGNLALWASSSALIYVSGAVTYALAYGNTTPFLWNVAFFFLSLLVESAIICWILSRTRKRSNGSNMSLSVSSSRINVAPFLVLALLFFVSYVILTDGDAIFRPRVAYQLKRDGIGWIWAGMIVFTTMYFVADSASKATFSRKLFLVTLFVMWCSGSKQLILGFIIINYFNPWLPRRYRKLYLYAALPFTLLAFYYLFGQLTAEDSFASRLVNYFDAFSLSARVFEDRSTGLLKYYGGEIWLSSWWGDVPRAIFPEKPYAYGSTYLLEVYYPGMAATGATPSFGEFTQFYADFGWVGIFAASLRFQSLLRFYALHNICQGRKGWREGFSVGYLLLPGFAFHFPVITILPLFWFLSRAKFRSSKVEVYTQS